MRSELATFLGDPNFPRIIMQAHKGERILMYQDLNEYWLLLMLMAGMGCLTKTGKALTAEDSYEEAYYGVAARM
ncbi:hypothetical protein CFRS1_v013086 [Colletotrichum fructicola]|nr:hypothetical protein CFRS1_v013086 [Colletotrichum fructicola]